jgi:isoleucyl-tRNA synthetase
VASENGLTVALDISISPELKAEGLARELVNRIQNMRKDLQLEVTDRITVKLDTSEVVKAAALAHQHYICAEVLANALVFETSSAPKTEEIEAAADTAIQLIK